MRHASAPDNEPEASNYPKPSPGEHIWQVVDCWENEEDHNIVTAKLEVIDDVDAGKNILHRVNIDDQEKSFFYCRQFLKSIGEPYKGEFDIDWSKWIGRKFVASCEINGKYCNISEYNFDKSLKIEQYKTPVGEIKNPGNITDPKDIAWDN